MRVIFLVGDAPPHLDYQDGFDYRRHVREAAARGIGVEAIQCGGDALTAAGLAGDRRRSAAGTTRRSTATAACRCR